MGILVIGFIFPNVCCLTYFMPQTVISMKEYDTMPNNPTPNDRNIEFDTKQNLIHGLDPLEQVSAL